MSAPHLDALDALPRPDASCARTRPATDADVLTPEEASLYDMLDPIHYDALASAQEGDEIEELPLAEWAEEMQGPDSTDHSEALDEPMETIEAACTSAGNGSDTTLVGNGSDTESRDLKRTSGLAGLIAEMRKVGRGQGTEAYVNSKRCLTQRSLARCLPPYE